MGEAQRRLDATASRPRWPTIRTRRTPACGTSPPSGAWCSTRSTGPSAPRRRPLRRSSRRRWRAASIPRGLRTLDLGQAPPEDVAGAGRGRREPRPLPDGAEAEGGVAGRSDPRLGRGDLKGGPGRGEAAHLRQHAAPRLDRRAAVLAAQRRDRPVRRVRRRALPEGAPAPRQEVGRVVHVPPALQQRPQGLRAHPHVPGGRTGGDRLDRRTRHPLRPREAAAPVQGAP